MQQKPLTVIEPASFSFGREWQEIRQYKDLLYFLVRRDVSVLYKQTVLGFAWAIIRPVFAMVVFSIVFGRLAKVPSDGAPYPVFSYVALVPWTYFAAALNASSQSLIGQANMFTKVYFPRIFIPITPVFSKLMDFFIAAGVLVLLMLFYNLTPTVNVIFIPFLILLMILTASGAGMWLSALSIQYRDVKHGLEFITQLLMFAAPVVWPASLVPEKFRLCYGLYPMAGVIEGFRAALIGSTPMPWDLILMSTITAILLFCFAVIYFKRKERIFADVV